MNESMYARQYEPVSLEVQADFIEEQELDTLLFCPHPWALRHRFINTATGEVVRARCGSWSCLYCGPRKVDMWRQLVKAAEPTLFITLTKCGSTLKEAARTLTTVLQYLRRGSKGRGKEKRGARPAYPLQVFAVLEEHSDFEENGFHWHLLVKGVDFLPNQMVSDALRSATGGRSYITKTVRVKNDRAVGYVTKYLTKEIMRERRGLVEEERTVMKPVLDPVDGYVNEQGNPYLFTPRLDEQGQPVLEEERQLVRRLCKSHRIRYSQQFFPMSTALLRQQLFGEKQEGQDYEAEYQVVSEEQAEQDASEDGQMLEERARSSWVLYEAEPLADEVKAAQQRLHAVKLDLEPDIEGRETRAEAYRRMRHAALLESVQAFREGRRMYSRRIIGIWSYQRQRLRMVG